MKILQADNVRDRHRRSPFSDLYEIGFGFVERRGLGDPNGDLVSALNQMIFKMDQRISRRQYFCPSKFLLALKLLP